MTKYLRISIIQLATVLLLGHNYAVAQITLTETILTDRFGTTEYISAFQTESGSGLQALVDASGENQMWNFSQVMLPDTNHFVQSLITLPANLPGNDTPEFAPAGFVEYTYAVDGTDTLKTFLYQSLESGNLLSHGTIIIEKVNGVQDTLVTLSTPPALDGVLPFEFGFSYSDSTTFILNGEPALTYQITEVTADGWGTLITPTKSVSALRLFNEEKTYLLSSGNLLSEFYSIDFISADGVIAEIELNELMQPVSASYAIFDNEMPTATEGSTEAPAKFALLQNFPNPFNPTTSITVELFEPAYTTLKVYTLTGKLISTLHDGYLPAGSHQISFDASGLASGLYLYKLESMERSQTQVMSLIK